MFRYIFYSLLFLTFSSAIEAQQLNSLQLDSLYYSIVKIRRPDLLRNNIEKFSEDTSHIKCGTSLFNAVRINLESFSIQQRSVLQKILDRPVTDTSFVSPEGFFRIHFNKSGTDVPMYSVQQFAEAADSVYNFEIKYLGYPEPPSDNGEGGDNKYDIYIMNIGNLYGYTVPETEITPGSNTYTAYTAIKNDFTGFYTTGINAARVTIAHEFEHAINVGNYINRYFSGDEFFYELSATAMEHFVFSTIKDYLQYLPTYFNDTQSSIAVNGSIEEFALAIWNIYQKDRFGFDIIKKEWELMPQMSAMDAINTVIQQYGSSLGTELNNFGIWMYFTNYRAVSGQYFEDASFYPIVKPLSTINFSSGSSVQLQTGPSSNSFVTIVNPAYLDTLVTIITNSDVQSTINSTNSLFSFNFTLYDHAVDGASKITDNYFINFSADQKAFWTTSEILNNSVVQPGQSFANQIDYPFPTPFIYVKNHFLYFPVASAENTSVQFYAYTSSMDLVYSSNFQLNYFNGQKAIRWNGLDAKNKKLSSGVYIYTIKSGGNLITGKFVIINQ